MLDIYTTCTVLFFLEEAKESAMYKEMELQVNRQLREHT